MAMTIITGIIALLKAIPAIKGMLDDLAAWYVTHELASMKKELQNAIIDVSQKQDQRGLEKVIGSPRTGLPSGEAGTEIRDSLPGVAPLDPPK